MRTIHKKAQENFEERGLETLSLACGLATWENKRAAWEPCAPVLLRPAELRPLGAAQDEFELTLVDEIEVNPTMRHLLKVDFDCSVTEERLAEVVDGAIDEAWELEVTYDWLRKEARRVPGLKVEPRLVLTNFAYAKLPMVRDLEGSFDELVAHGLIAAIAGDEEAREAVLAANPAPDSVPVPGRQPLADEFLVVDADSSQNYAINGVIAGQHLIVEGPPGTGKSQTIANLIGSLVARGQRVLFVAEKRAAIDAVLKRLDQRMLGDLVLDLHGGIGSRRAFAQTIGQALDAIRTVPPVDHSPQQKQVEMRRKELDTYVEALHRKRDPWGVSVYDIHAELLGLPESCRTELRLRDRDIEWVNADCKSAAEEMLVEYARLDGPKLIVEGNPWARAAITTDEQVRDADALVRDLQARLRRVVDALSAAARETGMSPAPALGEWADRLALWAEAARTLDWAQQDVYDEDLDGLIKTLAPAESGFGRIKASLFSAEYRAARDRLRELSLAAKVGDASLRAGAINARTEKLRWEKLGSSGLPTAPDGLDELTSSYRELVDSLARLRNTLMTDAIAALPEREVETFLNSLTAERGTLVNLPELRRLETELEKAKLGESLAEIKQLGCDEEECVDRFRWLWHQSILDHLTLADRLVAGFKPDNHEKAIGDFQRGDREHVKSTAARIRQIWAHQAIQAQDQHPDQAALVRHQAGLKRKHIPVRDFVRNASDVLLALKPCWAMSPLLVSQLLPPKTYFDVVVFDEASQITPAESVTSILRGRQLVVAGDRNQLPPTAFFVSENPDEEEEDDENAVVAPIIAGTKGFESILEALGSLLSYRRLLWHYRSRDERLIAFSNAHIYNRSLVTFPGARGGDVFRHVLVPWEPGAETNSPTPEANAVVDLIIEHARTRGHESRGDQRESLGVIAMGIKHANRIEEALRQRLHNDEELAQEIGDFFDEAHEERFFVKNLERVQGDERDAIILTIGYGKNARGDLPYRFGPLLMEGGHRRLNVAITRAKRRLTLVSSFDSKDMDPEKSDAEGVKLLRQYLQFIESDGTNLGDQIVEKPALNPFELDVQHILTRHGLQLVPQYGTSGYWIDFAVKHPSQPGRFVLAIECDGATYHSSESARDRDRLRQEQLQRLGWRFHRIWSSEWFHAKDKALEKALASYQAALSATDSERDTPEGRELVSGPLEAMDARPEKNESVTASREMPRPRLPTYAAITDISHWELAEFVRWIESDGLRRTEAELLEETKRELGFQRSGSRIVTAITAAIRAARG